jgi:hypothetical protein
MRSVYASDGIVVSNSIVDNIHHDSVNIGGPMMETVAGRGKYLFLRLCSLFCMSPFRMIGGCLLIMLVMSER